MTVAASLPSLSSRLRAETKDAHVRAERSGIMRRLLRGEIERDDYLRLLVALAAVYEALETALDEHAADPTIAAFGLAALRRGPALDADIAALAGHGSPVPEPCDAARDYATHLRSLGVSSPTLLLAHAYVRYLGDLSGGQILRDIVARALGLAAGTGTAFYDFSDVGDPAELKRGVRDALDALPAAQADALVGEALRAFAMHERLFTELDAPR